MFIDAVGISKIAGYLSIISWLCAQFPQVLKNYHLKSCEGLSLPFLVTWLFGDVTNLIGCVLTDQLPFQTWLAIYFTTVDITLLYQFFYYQALSVSQHSSLPPLETDHITYAPNLSQSLILPSSRPAVSPHTRANSYPAGERLGASQPALRQDPQRESSTSRIPRSATTPQPHPHTSFRSSTDPYSAIYAAAVDVAKAAEVAGRKRSQSRRARLHRQNTTTGVSDVEEIPEDMIASFYSDRSATGEPVNSSHLAVSGLLDRGRSLRRNASSMIHVPTPSEDTVAQNQGQPSMSEISRDNSRSLSLVRGSGGRGKGRRTAGVAFMALGLMFTWSSLSTRGISSSGRVLARDHFAPVQDMVSSGSLGIPLIPSEAMMAYDTSPHGSHPHEPHFPDPLDPTFQRVVGRISAWICTTLYLTSRLPQIWKNFTRHSVEGLSIFLFTFAFMGNLFYTFSILINPAGTADPADAGHYLLEALPYLLGSGGTLMFDMTIIIQSFVYGSSPPIGPSSSSNFKQKRTRPPHHRHRSHAASEDLRSSLIAEDEPLLASATDTSVSRERSASPRVALRTHSTHEDGLHTRHTTTNMDV